MGGSGPGSLMKLQPRCCTELQSYEDLMGAGRSAFKMAYSYGYKLLLAISQRLFSSLTHRLLHRGCLRIFMTWWLAFHRMNEWSKVKVAISFVTCLRGHSVTSAIFCWSHRPSLIQCGRVFYKGINCRRWESLETILQSGYHTSIYWRLKGSVNIC